MPRGQNEIALAWGPGGHYALRGETHGCHTCAARGLPETARAVRPVRLGSTPPRAFNMSGPFVHLLEFNYLFPLVSQAAGGLTVP